MGIKAYIICKKVCSHHTCHVAQIELILDRGILGEDIRKIVDEAERLSTTNQSVTKTSKSSRRPALPSPRHHHTKLSSVTPDHGRVSKRRLLPASSPSTSVSTREYPFHQAPESHAQSTQSISSYPYRRNDYYSM